MRTHAGPHLRGPARSRRERLYRPDNLLVDLPVARVQNLKNNFFFIAEVVIQAAGRYPSLCSD